MNTEDFFLLLGDIDSRYLPDTRPVRRPVRWRRWAALAACGVLALALLMGPGKRIPLSDASSGVTVRYADRLPAGAGQSSACLVSLTEEELFTRWDLLIVRGTIESIQNISLDFRGDKHFRAIATVRVENVLQGTAGETVTVLLPCPITEGFHASAADTAAAMREGMEGVFMAMVYDEASLFQADGGSLCLRDIAETGLADGVRWAFLETPEGLLFDRQSYAGAAGAETLEDVEDYIREMLARVR